MTFTSMMPYVGSRFLKYKTEVLRKEKVKKKKKRIKMEWEDSLLFDLFQTQFSWQFLYYKDDK